MKVYFEATGSHKWNEWNDVCKQIHPAARLATFDIRSEVYEAVMKIESSDFALIDLHYKAGSSAVPPYATIQGAKPPIT